MAECRRKGIPQAEYCKNGFVDISMKLLRSSLSRQSVLSKERDKWRSEFVLELSSDHWKKLPRFFEGADTSERMAHQ